ncbi:RNA polymerase sigma-70 factor (ECF subfamily) [Pedobacter cryoconitis]|uniref:RNA polymerase sigma-70 factor (ECF subfamily) n=1 Tax=Pedobacter cryoconitis TaxID=188932 RepID=A0A7W8ZHI5_9SPHI|nr:RNA polymerase sigma factor [Pedobacter cryoconitis]MBB5634159.1 RNA polymerase sigma-70 factor (ECF subfamily) [Pedobacter cryoconitis]
MLLPIVIYDAKTESLPKISIAGDKEKELIRDLKRMDMKAFSFLYRQYAPALLSIILKVVKSRETAEDVLQEAFAKISSRICLYDEDKGRLFTWMSKIAKNKALDQMKTRGAFNSTKNIELEGIMKLVEMNNFCHYNPDIIGIGQLTRTLNPLQKDVLDLVYFQGYSHSEAAKILNIPIGTVKTRIRISILILRKYFTVPLVFDL